MGAEPGAGEGSGAGVLFDVDGTLVDTNYLHTVAWWGALRQYGHVVPMASIHRAIGMGADRLLAHLLGDGRDRDGDAEISAAHASLYRTQWERLEPLPGARELVRACASAGLKVVLASSAKADELAALRRVLDADAAIAAATSADDAETSKPAPDILEVALRRGRLDRDRTVLVGDAVWDVHAARHSGLPCVGVACGGTSAHELTAAGAVEVYPDPAALLRDLGGSALGRLLEA